MKRKRTDVGPPAAGSTALRSKSSEREPVNTVRFDAGTFTLIGGNSRPLTMDESPQLSIPRSASTGDAQPIGTLMIDKGGRSKYLGPTAGSDWLKDVGHMCSMTLIYSKNLS